MRRFRGSNGSSRGVADGPSLTFHANCACGAPFPKVTQAVRVRYGLLQRGVPRHGSVGSSKSISGPGNMRASSKQKWSRLAIAVTAAVVACHGDGYVQKARALKGLSGGQLRVIFRTSDRADPAVVQFLRRDPSYSGIGNARPPGPARTAAVWHPGVPKVTPVLRLRGNILRIPRFDVCRSCQRWDAASVGEGPWRPSWFLTRSRRGS